MLLINIPKWILGSRQALYCFLSCSLQAKRQFKAMISHQRLWVLKKKLRSFSASCRGNPVKRHLIARRWWSCFKRAWRAANCPSFNNLWSQLSRLRWWDPTMDLWFHLESLWARDSNALRLTPSAIKKKPNSRYRAPTWVLAAKWMKTLALSWLNLDQAVELPSRARRNFPWIWNQVSNLKWQAQTRIRRTLGSTFRKTLKVRICNTNTKVSTVSTTCKASLVTWLLASH